MTVCAFVAPYLMPATLDFVAAAAYLPGVRLALITTESASRLPDPLRAALAGHWRIDSPLDPNETAGAVRGPTRQLGPVGRLLGSLEQLQVPLARVREALGIEGDGFVTVRDRDTDVVREALQRLISDITIEVGPREKELAS